MSAGFSDEAFASASVPEAATQTAKPPFLRYIATNEAMDSSSSTTSTFGSVWFIPPG